ncbi:aminoglycoside phosphotransferase family protein [Kouleothrix sp.]|uniref:aminoglycoside phosphotransferase family protein n=1 Tax=Kouleothrix sp. TaxID=2779161 RepID=UPI003918D554
MSQTYPIPAPFARTIAELYGDAGRAWLADLPSRLAACARRWDLALGPPFALSYNYVAPAARADGTPLVLKLGVPNPELASEAAALRHYAGRGIARLLDDDGLGALLLERLLPGTALAAIEDDAEATALAAEVMRRLWRPPPEAHLFPTTERWGRGFARLRERFGGGTGPLPHALVARAERLFADLLASAGAPALLHGDLHHGNILAAARAPWLAIDPKGVVGEPAYEAGALLRNPIERVLGAPSPARLLARRVDILADALGLDRARLVGWGLAQAVLSAWWSIEDHGYGWERAIALAEHLSQLEG